MLRLLLIAVLLTLTSCTTVTRHLTGGSIEDATAALHNAQIGDDPAGERCAAAKLDFAEKTSQLQIVGPASAIEAVRVKRLWLTKLERECAEVVLDMQRFLLRLGR